MKKALLALALMAGLPVLANAGDKGYVVEKNPVAPACYGAGYEFGVFGAAIFPESHYDDSLGGGVSLGYFFNENLGVQASAAIYATDSEVHNYTVDAVYRLPINCIAPYLLVGGGVHTNGATEGLFRFGGGIDVRIIDSTSIFADGTYNLLSSDIDNYTTARVGLRFAF